MELVQILCRSIDTIARNKDVIAPLLPPYDTNVDDA